MTERPRPDAAALLARAKQAREGAYAPYSGLSVGAAVLTASGKVFAGANVENASYGLTVCAERVAIWTAVAAGERDIVAVAVAGDPGVRLVPCGACLQVMSEFGPDMEVIVERESGELEVYRLRALLPERFSLGAE
jgi:cytidine deaminase